MCLRIQQRRGSLGPILVNDALIITRNGEQSLVMLSLDDYKALEGTAYLLRTHAGYLLAAAAQLNAGNGVERSIAQ